MTATHKIFIIETPLSDGSPVFAVGVFDTDQDGRGVTFDAIDYRHALAMANAIKMTADANTLSCVEIIDRSLIGPRFANFISVAEESAL